MWRGGLLFLHFSFSGFGSGTASAPAKANANDPRAKLKPGLFDAGEAALGIKHVSLTKKPASFELGIDPNSPKVASALSSLGIGNPSQIPANMRMTIAGLALANSDLAFQGKHLFMGNFYGMNIRWRRGQLQQGQRRSTSRCCTLSVLRRGRTRRCWPRSVSAAGNTTGRISPL